MSSPLYQIHRLSVDDCQDMLAIESAAHTHPWSLASLQDCFGRFYRVEGLFENHQLLGFSIVQQIIDEVTLMDICVSPTVQGRGIGRLLLDSVITQAKAHAGVKIMLEVRQSNLAAISLYQKSGFVEIGRRQGYYPSESGAEDAILMDLSW
ncbi:ribosomal protein S18-alanine N-acetyltransferase [Shewanella gaetbuli]